MIGVCLTLKICSNVSKSIFTSTVIEYGCSTFLSTLCSLTIQIEAGDIPVDIKWCFIGFIICICLIIKIWQLFRCLLSTHLSSFVSFLSSFGHFYWVVHQFIVNKQEFFVVSKHYCFVKCSTVNYILSL